MVKLTEAQRLVISRLQLGDTLVFMSGRNARLYFQEDTGNNVRRTSAATMHALYKAGLTRQTKAGNATSVFHIGLTDAGREWKP